jgi:hypothetical protein
LAQLILTMLRLDLVQARCWSAMGLLSWRTYSITPGRVLWPFQLSG